MNRAAYYGDPAVRDFLAWARPFISNEAAIRHQWTSPKWGTRAFTSFFGAYEAFDWKFSVVFPGESIRTHGRSFAENVMVLDRLRHLLRESAAREDADAFIEAAVSILRWGGVQHGNEPRLRALGATALPMLMSTSHLLDPEVADLRRLRDVTDMNSGFSKIYSLFLDGFPIYDSRVACTMACLVRLYCQDREVSSVPRSLAFGIPASRGGTGRDPSTLRLIFPKLRWGQWERYARSNVMAAWLLDALAEETPFGELDPPERQFALQSAMFMLGYGLLPGLS